MRQLLLLDLVRSKRLVELVDRRGGHSRGAQAGAAVGRLEPGPRDVHDDALVGPDAALASEPPKRRDRPPTRRLGEDALGAGEKLDATDDLVVAHRREPAARLTHRVE